MPAAAVIPAPIAYIKVVAVKKLVVESVCHSVGSPLAVFNWHYVVRPTGGLCSSRGGPTNIPSRCSSLSVEVGRYVYFEQIRVLKAGYLRLNTVCME